MERKNAFSLGQSYLRRKKLFKKDTERVPAGGSSDAGNKTAPAKIAGAVRIYSLVSAEASSSSAFSPFLPRAPGSMNRPRTPKNSPPLGYLETLAD